ncbi:MAG: tail fiber domain-containing protein [Planctomycetota bacterium]
MNARYFRYVLTAIAVLPFAGDAHAADVGTAFTYQGFLEKPAGTPVGTPAPVFCDFEFTLWDDADPGAPDNQLGPTLTFAGLEAVEVTDGVFTVVLNFGANAINGQPRWLGIRVCCPSACALESLDPRVELTPAPYSIRAGEGVGGPNALNVTPSGDVGIGTTTPGAKLDVAGIAGTDGIRFPDGTLQTTAASGDGHSLDAADGSLIDAVYVDNSGKVGIGTTTPAARLDVNGAARTTTLEITGGLPPGGPLAGWGWNDYGQTNVPAGRYVVVSAGDFHGLAIRSDGTLAGWGCGGGGDYGQCNVPAGTFTAIAAGGAHSLAIRSDGTLIGWGANGAGQINVPSGTFTAIAAGFAHSLAIRSDGTLIGWGANGAGQINVPSGTIATVAAGYAHSLAISSNGTLVGWGCGSPPYNYGQCNVPSGTFTAVAAGWFQSLAIRSDGTLVGWGCGAPGEDYGQCNVPSGTFTAVAAGDYHSLAIRSDGTLIGWGDDSGGQIDVPVGTFTAVAAGGSASLAVETDAMLPALRLYSDSAYKPGTNTWTIWSDRRLKKNIEPLSGALERLLQLRGVTFQWLDPASQGGITGTQMGLIADEVQRAFPQWVGRDPKGYQTLTVGGFEALTAEALRELRQEKDAAVRKLQEENAELHEMLKRVSERIVALEGGR